MVFGAGDVFESNRSGGRRRGRAERPRGSVEGVEQHRPGARYSVRDGACGFARSREQAGELRIENGGGRDAQVARGGFYAPLAHGDQDAGGRPKASGRPVEEGRIEVRNMKPTNGGLDNRY